MTFFNGIFINAQVSWGGQHSLSTQTQPSLREMASCLLPKTAPGKTGTNLFLLTHMSHRALADLFANRFPPSLCGSAAATTSFIGFGKGFATAGATKSTFEHDQMHLISSQTDIALASFTTVMDVLTQALTMRA